MTYRAFKTADTNELITTAAPFRPVYQLLPDNQESYECTRREELENFMVYCAPMWLFTQNIDAMGIDISDWSIGARFGAVSALVTGQIFRDKATGEIWHINRDNRNLVPGHYANSSSHDVIPDLGDSAVNLVKAGKLEALDIGQHLNLPYPLKFSFNPEAKYEDLPASPWGQSDKYPYEVHSV